ncbi:tRNA (N(6)-L-threonylcarbamoyladenosine(37)-C(2))-methylthiotransferase MtaB [Aquisalinus flavus]|uniref:tRNA (N(6)-L-threonylcarbamoyladenosine(37)-C(2))-methylthiotransferase n=1 Tax=Aquisalinus flavus TaxID=1526572 RepID=A0A8J2V6J2_9PROT|nr:tRNA (N(6)-L-threonylcarbamoyladenosine(37)-C(2))-methylthiotransferase MtaB [Aquisalinus flavus]
MTGRKTEVVTLGCRLNAYESEKMAELAKSTGLSDTIIINTCAVTNEAVRQARQAVRKARKRAPGARIVVTGCAAQIDPDGFSSLPEVDAVIGNADKLTATAWQSVSAGNAAVVGDIMQETTTETATPLPRVERARAYVQIQNGCDHRCTFCIIPYGRGNSRSVPIADVVAECRAITAQGVKEVVLTGVDVTSYGPDLPGMPTLGMLVSRILKEVPELPRLRLSSIDGAEIDGHLFELLVSELRIAPYLHLSLQAGDNMILKRMKRRHTREQAIAFCAGIKERRPEVTFGADIIAGFPTETDEMFENSLKLVEECALTFLHVFPYSARKGTPAARMPQLDGAIIKDRAARLRAAGDAALERHLAGFVGNRMSVLTEKAGKDGTGHARLADFTEVRFEAGGNGHLRAAGHIIDVIITGHDGRALVATL